MSAPLFTPGPWSVCQHLKGVAEDAACGCGYRGVVYGPDDDKAICQPGHEPAPKGQEGSEPGRYPREVEIANANLIASAPELYAALADAVEALERAREATGFGQPAYVIAGERALAKARGEAS